MKDDDFDTFEFDNEKKKFIYIQMVARRGKKTNTIVTGIP